MSLRAILILAGVALFGMVGCDRDSGDGDDDGQALRQTGRIVYPGSSIFIPMERREGVLLNADGGSMVWASEGDLANYIAPVEQGNYGYSVIDSNNDEVLATSEVTVTIAPAAELMNVEIGENSLSATYGDVKLKSELNGETATAVFSTGDADDQLVAKINASGTGSLTYRGVEMDGYGPLEPEAAAALHSLATGPLGRAVTMIPLDLGCADGNEVLNDQVFAPVLMPWQMILKYEVSNRGLVIRHFMADSVCGFTGRFERVPEKPFNRLVLWDVDHSVPSVHLFFPFNGDGQLPSPAD